MKQSLSFSTRARRAEFFAVWGVHCGLLAAGYAVLKLAPGSLIGLRFFGIGFLMYILTLPFALAAVVRRLHDVGQSGRRGGTFFLLGSVALVAAIWLYLPYLNVAAHLALARGNMQDLSAAPDAALYVLYGPGIIFGTAAHTVFGALFFVFLVLPLLLFSAVCFACLIRPMTRVSTPQNTLWGPAPHGVLP